MAIQRPLPFVDAAPAPGPAAAHALLAHALPAEPGVWDELRDASGHLRPAWQRFAAVLPQQDGLEMPEALDARVAQLAARIRHDGVTHNVFGPEGVAPRPWSLELLPLLIEPADWAQIEAGVLQRATLLQQVLADLYGPQRLLHEGLLPPALLLRHPGFLRGMVGAQVPGGQRLYIVAFDVARGPDGGWHLLAPRTQGPSGLGYVLQNRLLVSRQFPDAFRELRVQHIASSYRRLLDSIEQRAAPLAGGHAPRSVLLTPGPFNETYFEHAYLARYLGLPLVEGGDLTVRGERLYLKTVQGLEPVHAVLRRVDDDWCDPLELRPDSALGVPGLLQAARAGGVVVANALGSAVLETPALQGFLPALAQRLLGEPLRLPSLPTWWCGEAAAWAQVQGDLAGRVLRRTFPRAPGENGAAAVDRRADQVEQDPDAWTVQGRLRFSRAPIWGQGAVTPRPAMVRVFAVADAQGRWHVLPGGMTRVAQREDASVSMQRGGSSLDTWVLTDGTVDTFSMLPQRLRVDDIAQRSRPVSSRTGENLFWLGRYTERSEQQVRLARITLQLLDADIGTTPALQRALSALAVQTGLVGPGVPTLAQSPPLFERALLAALADAQGSWSVGFNLAALARAASALRERLSPQLWRGVRDTGEGFASALAAGGGGPPSRAQALGALDQLGWQLAALTGAQTDRMTRDHGWRLLATGRLLERLIGVSARLQALLPALDSPAGVDLLLELFDSAITFRARYQRHDDLLALTDLLVLDPTNPRSFAGVLRRLRTEIGKLPGDAGTLQPLLALLPAEGAGLTLETLRDADDAAVLRALSGLSASLGAAAAQLADRIAARFFTLAHGVDQRF